MSGDCIYRKKYYSIYSTAISSEYIIHNTKKPFEDCHTHVSNYNLCKIIIYGALNGELPKRSQRLLKNKRVLESLIILTMNDSYITKYNDILQKIKDRDIV